MPGWSHRGGQSSVVIPDGSIVLMGGSGNGLNDVWRSTDNGLTWTEVTASAGWPGRYDYSSVVIPDGSIVLMGGLNNNSVGLNDVWRSTDNGTTWTEMNASAGWSSRWGFSSVAMPDGSIVLMGGYRSIGGTLNDVWRSTDDGATWTEMSPPIEYDQYGNPIGGGARGREEVYFSAVTMPDGSIVLMGGYNYQYPWDIWTNYNDVWRSTDDGATWTEMTVNAGWRARYQFSSVAMPDGSIVLMSGLPRTLDDVWRSMDNGSTWTEMTANARWPGRCDYSSVVIPDGSIVLMGGLNNNSVGLNDVWRLQPVESSAQNPSHTYTQPGSYQVALQVYNDNGYNSTRKVGYINVTGAPTITGISPQSGSPAGGNTVIITGTGFIGTTNVMFGDNPASFTINSDTSITAKVPGGYPGTIVDVTVANSAGDSLESNSAKYIYAPIVTGVSPASGSTKGTNEVTITGEGFLDASKVMFGTVPSPEFGIYSDDEISAEVPPGSAGTVDVTVTILNGVTSATSIADQYTYTATTPQPKREIGTIITPVTSATS